MNGLSMGIDQSLNNTAVVVIDFLGKVLFQETKIGYSLPTTAKWWERNERLDFIVNRISEIFNSFDNEIDIVVIEGPSLGSRGATLFFAGELFHMLSAELAVYHEDQLVGEIVEVAPKSLKMFVTGNGNSKKPQIAAHVQKRWDIIFDDDNLTDAFGLAQIGRFLLKKNTEILPAKNMSALDKVVRYG